MWCCSSRRECVVLQPWSLAHLTQLCGTYVETDGRPKCLQLQRSRRQVPKMKWRVQGAAAALCAAAEAAAALGEAYQ